MSDAIDLSKLKQAALAATPGPWIYVKDNEYDDWQLISEADDDCVWIKQDDSGVPIPEYDGAFIAMANPDTVKRLIQIIEVQGEALNEVIGEGHSTACESMKPYRQGFTCHVETAAKALDTVRRILEGEL